MTVSHSPREVVRVQVGHFPAGDGDDGAQAAATVPVPGKGLAGELEFWQRILQSAPDDVEAARAVSRLTIELGRRRAGLEPRAVDLGTLRCGGELSKERSGEPAPSPSAQAQLDRPGISEPGRIRLTPIQQLEVAVRDHPADPENYLRLVPLYLEKERDYDAERLLDKGKEATGDARVRQLWEDVTMLRLEKKIEYARREAERNDTPQTRTELSQLRAERDRFEIDAFTSRCRRDPASASLRYELGLRLRRAGKLRAACEEFEQALRDPGQRSAAAFELGQCRAQFFEYPEALRNYRLSADAAAGHEQLECKKESLYRAAELALRVKLRRVAQHYLEELLRIDPHYRDAARLLENFTPVVV